MKCWPPFTYKKLEACFQLFAKLFDLDKVRNFWEIFKAILVENFGIIKRLKWPKMNHNQKKVLQQICMKLMQMVDL